MAPLRAKSGAGAKNNAGVLAPGVRVAGARYLLKRVLGRGSFSEVWQAWDRTIEHDVALKFLPVSVLNESTRLNAIREEVHRSLRLTHPAIARVYDFVQHRDHAAIAMEYVDGWSLAALRVDRVRKRFTLGEVESWLQPLAAALDYAHYEFKYVHGDLKPSNLFLNGREQFRLADFGVGPSLRQGNTRRDQAMNSKTLGYLSPQQIQGAEVTIADDIYGLGSTLFDLLTGTLPFRGNELPEQIINIKAPLLGERLSEFDIQEDIPVAWEETIAACLEKDPGKRPQSVSQVLSSLQPRQEPTQTEPQSEPVVENMAPFLPLADGMGEQRLGA